MKKPTSRIAILGAGNIGLSIAEGIRAAGMAEGRVIVTRKRNQFSTMENRMFSCVTDNRLAVSLSDIVIVAVRPNQAEDLLEEIHEPLQPRHLVISVVTGVPITRMEKILGQVAITRAMPNTAIRVRQSMTALAFNSEAEKHQTLVESLFGSVGLTLRVPENRFPEATGLFASGIAFGLEYMRGYQQSGIQHAFNEHEALMIAAQVMKGAAMLVQDGNRHPEMEIDKVTTTRGCTIDGVVELVHAGLKSATHRGMDVCIAKAHLLDEKK